MLKIKLSPRGKMHQRTFRIVVAECRSKNNGKYIDELGFYTPQTKTLEIDKAKVDKWLKNGAQLATGVDKLLNPDKFPKKIKKKVEIKEEKPIEVTPEVKKEEVAEVTPEVKEVKEENDNSTNA